MQLPKKKIIHWTIVASVIALLILAYLLVAVPRDVPKNLQEIPLSEITDSGNTILDDKDDKKSDDSQMSDNNDQNDDGSDDNDQDSDDEPDDNGQNDDQDDNNDDQDDNDDDQDDDETPPNDHYPPMKWGLHKQNHNDNANQKADDVRYGCNGKFTGNPFINGMMQKL